MDNLQNIGFILALLTSVGFTAAHADETHDHDHNHSSQHAHVHGAWELFAALDEKQLSITVKAPLIDIIGFEHTPSTTEERIAIREMQGRLAEPQAFFELDKSAQCTLTESVEIKLPKAFEDANAEDDANDSHQPGKHDGKHTHKHEQAATNSEQYLHTSDVEASYVFECRAPKKLQTITPTAFDIFPSIERIDAVFLGDTTQKASRLTRNAKILRIR